MNLNAGRQSLRRELQQARSSGFPSVDFRGAQVIAGEVHGISASSMNASPHRVTCSLFRRNGNAIVQILPEHLCGLIGDFTRLGQRSHGNIGVIEADQKTIARPILPRAFVGASATSVMSMVTPSKQTRGCPQWNARCHSARDRWRGSTLCGHPERLFGNLCCTWIFPGWISFDREGGVYKVASLVQPGSFRVERNTLAKSAVSAVKSVST